MIIYVKKRCVYGGIISLKMKILFSSFFCFILLVSLPFVSALSQNISKNSSVKSEIIQSLDRLSVSEDLVVKIKNLLYKTDFKVLSSVNSKQIEKINVILKDVNMNGSGNSEYLTWALICFLVGVYYLLSNNDVLATFYFRMCLFYLILYLLSTIDISEKDCMV